MARTEDAPRFVLNEKGNDIAVVHAESCGTIQHQVRRDLREHDGGLTYEYVGKNEGGYSIILEKPRTGASYYRARLVSVDELIALTRRYRRCQHCAPDVPESPRVARPEVARMLARSITPKHLGRVFVGVGPLVSVRMSASGYELVGEDGSLTRSIDGSVEYLKTPI